MMRASFGAPLTSDTSFRSQSVQPQWNGHRGDDDSEDDGDDDLPASVFRAYRKAGAEPGGIPVAIGGEGDNDRSTRFRRATSVRFNNADCDDTGDDPNGNSEFSSGSLPAVSGGFINAGARSHVNRLMRLSSIKMPAPCGIKQAAVTAPDPRGSVTSTQSRSPSFKSGSGSIAAILLASAGLGDGYGSSGIGASGNSIERSSFPPLRMHSTEDMLPGGGSRKGGKLPPLASLASIRRACSSLGPAG